MTTENIKKERFDQLGLPPMELAESSANNNNNNGMYKCLLPMLLKIMLMLLLTILGTGTYLLLSNLLEKYDNTRNTRIIFVQDNSNPAVLTNFIRLFNTTSEDDEVNTRQKRDTDSTASDSPSDNILTDWDEFHSINFNDEQLQKAREIIMKHDILCSEKDKQGICKDLVEKLKEITSKNVATKHEGAPKMGDNEKDVNNNTKQSEAVPTDVAKREALLQTHYGNDIDTVPVSFVSNNSSQHDPAHNCFVNLLKKYPRHKELFVDPSDEYLAHHELNYEQPLSSQARFYSSAHASYPQNRAIERPRPKIHPQDVDILMSFLTPKSELTATEKPPNMTREVSCPSDSIACISGDTCIAKKQWCDGNVDCADVSDEARCTCKSRVDEGRLCDGYFDCPFGEDEMGCFGCGVNMFSCEDLDMSSRSTCFTKEQRCNGVADCPNRKDEVECNTLTPSLLKKPIFPISNTEGFLHRNFKGDWYAVCKNPYMWAHDVCRRETGHIIRPPFIQRVPIDPMLKMNYINSDPGGLLQTSDSCLNFSAIYVTCPDMLCGTRVQSTSQLLKENAAIENHLFGRNKRHFETNHPYPLMFYGKRWKRNTDDFIGKTNFGIKFDTLKNGKSFDKMRNKRTESRVVGGKPSQPAAWPWMVAMYRDGMFHCGGVVITHSWVISAAHCVSKFWDHYYEIQVGMLRRFSYSPQEQSHKVTHVIVNQHYSQSDMKNDLSLLKVEPAIQFSRWVRPICLPNPDTAGTDWLWGPAAGTLCTAVGWGATTEHGPDPDHMREVEVPIWEFCKHKEDRAGKEICAGLMEGGKDACQGDSGGPLLCRNPLNSQQWYMAGIVSHGDGCGRKDEPGVYTRVSLFVKWIRYHISSNSLPIIQPIQDCPGFRCDSGISKCLPIKRKCDKIVDCLDAEDEVNCEYTTTVSPLSFSAPKTEFLGGIFATKGANLNYLNITSNEKNNDPDYDSTMSNIIFSTSTSNLEIVSSKEKEEIISSTSIVETIKSEHKEYSISSTSTIDTVGSATNEEIISSTNIVDTVKSIHEEGISTSTGNLDTADSENKEEVISTANIIDVIGNKNEVEIISTTNTVDTEKSIHAEGISAFTSAPNIVMSENKNEIISSTNIAVTVSNENKQDIISSTSYVDTVGSENRQETRNSTGNADTVVSENKQEIVRSTSTIDTASNINKEELINEFDKELDFKHASTVEISISRSRESSFSNSEEHVTSDPSGLFSHESSIEDRGDIDTITIEHTGKPLESGSSVLEKLKEDTTMINLTFTTVKAVEINNNQGNTETATSTFIKQDNNDIFENAVSTTQINLLDRTELPLMTTRNSAENQLSERETKSDDDIIQLLPNIDIPDQTGATTNQKEKIELIPNKKQNVKDSPKILPDSGDKSVLLNKIEDLVSSEIQPAIVRRKHRMPKEFQCRRIYQMIPYYQRCDRKADCEDGTDELDCTCSDYLATFEEKLICDGTFDCADGHDESNCYSCNEDKFLCKQSQLCLPLKNVCDGKPHCPQGEDELDCFTLSNGKEIEYDSDGRPVTNLEGYLTTRHFNNWHVVCDDKLTLEQQEQAATHICHYLGFSSANKYYVKYINLKENEIAKRSLVNNRQKREAMEPTPVHFAYRQANEANDTDHHIIIKDAQVIKEQCVPNITKTCKSLYVFCDHSLYTDFDNSQNIFLRSTEVAQKHTWPWIAKVYIEGQYKCTGVLVNLSWVLISESCLWDSSLAHHYITVVLGSHRTLEAINGLYEQVYQVDAKKDIYHSRSILLHLKQPANYSKAVKPMVVSSSFSYIDSKTNCVAIGGDNKNNTISIMLRETKDSCNLSNRCFVRQSSESICPPNTSVNRIWAGIISCHTDQGWFPAASFVDSRGECGLVDRINATDIENLKNEIKFYDKKKTLQSSVDSNYIDDCEGIRCGRGRCVSLAHMCDGIRDCEDGNDESENACDKKHTRCSIDPYDNGCECAAGQMKCRNGKCVSKAVFRDGNNDCGDGTDEPGQATCLHYLKRIMPSRLCDGILHCHDRSDEDPMYCKCFAKRNFKCGSKWGVDYCVAPDMVCDGVRDCPDGDDENTCIALNAPQGTPYGTGQVIIRSHGVWYSKCYPTQNHTKSDLEAICAELGFVSGHAKQIHQTDKLVGYPHNNIILDPFNDIILNNNTSIKMRNAPEPIATPIFDQKQPNCYPVFIECL